MNKIYFLFYRVNRSKIQFSFPTSKALFNERHCSEHKAPTERVINFRSTAPTLLRQVVLFNTTILIRYFKDRKMLKK